MIVDDAQTASVSHSDVKMMMIMITDKEDFGVNIRGFKLWYSTFYQTVVELEFRMGEWFKHHYSMTPSNPYSCSMNLSMKGKNPLILHDYIGASKCAVDSYKCKECRVFAHMKKLLCNLTKIMISLTRSLLIKTWKIMTFSCSGAWIIHPCKKSLQQQSDKMLSIRVWNLVCLLQSPPY